MCDNLQETSRVSLKIKHAAVASLGAVVELWLKLLDRICSVDSLN